MTIRKTLLLLAYGTFAFMLFLFSFNCFGQDSLKTRRILIIESKTIEAFHSVPTQRILYISRWVTVRRYSNNKRIWGRLDVIGDSSIVINGNTILIKDIKRISSVRGRGIALAGLAISQLSLGLFYYETQIPQNGSSADYSSLALDTFLTFCVPIGLTVCLIGVIDMATVRHYHLDRDFTIAVKSIPIK